MKLIKYIKRKLTGGFKEQLIAVFVAGIVISSAISTILISSFTADRVKLKLETEGYQVTKDFADRNTLTLLYLSKESARESVQAIKNFPDVAGVGVFSHDKKPLIIDGENSIPAGEETWPDKLELVKETSKAWYFASPVYAQGADPEIAELPFIDSLESKELLGYVRVYVSKNTLDNLVSSIYKLNIVITLVLSALLLFILLPITDRVIKPLKQLSGYMREAEEGNLQIRSPLWGNREITSMQSAFNTMMTSLADREEKLETARQAALQYAHAKGEFAANVSHELRTPLNGILGMLEILKDTELSPKQDEYATVAHDSGITLLKLIDDILNFSKIDAGKVEIEDESFNLRELLDDIVGVLTGQARTKDLDIAYVIDKDVPSQISGDPSRIRQLLINLGGNAVKFTDKGEVGFRVHNIRDSSRLLTLRFEVIDTGLGISKEAQKKIFEAFQQADASTTKHFGGTGLGLAICRQLVEIMNGKIGVDSNPGEGSIFWFELPFKDSIKQSSHVKNMQKAAMGLRVCVADDSEIIRHNMEHTFENWGAHVVTTENGNDLVEILRKATKSNQPFNVAFIDELMPEINGIELIRNIAKDDQIAPLKLVLMTNQKNPDAFVDRFREIDTYIKKPIRQSNIYNSISELINEPIEEVAHQLQGKKAEKKETPYFNATILVVEDNRANQQVAQAMLDRLGCKCSIASNGIEALKLLESTSYDAVFMDCNMPEMDGYETTRQIRQINSLSSQIPIIAMTANVLEGDREKCIEAGMNDYAKKPLKLDTLVSVLEKWLNQTKEAQSQDDNINETRNTFIDRSTIVGTDDSNAIHRTVIINLREDVGDAFNEMVEVYIEDMGVLLRSLEKSVLENNASTLTHYAHTIKGSSANFGAERLAHIAKNLEDMGRKNKLDGAEELVQILFTETDIVINELKKELNLYKDETLLVKHDSARILIADDDRSMRVALQNVLVADGYEIEVVSDGVDAVSRCEKSMPDLILLDALMPNLNGFEACKKIRMLRGSSHIPILIVTALDDEKSIERAFDSGATDYIPKPIHFAVMRQRISRLLKASRAEVHVRELAYNDSLTGLPNRTMFIDNMEKLIDKVRPRHEMLAVMFLDLDRFKYVNDTLGHNVGDMLLKAVAERIVSCVRSADTVARLGGDEFTLALDGIEDRNIVANIAEKICRKVGEPYTFLSKDIYVTASIGISMHPHDGDNIEMLMKRADTAMFRAKERGGSYLFYESEMEAMVTNKVEIEQDLRQSLDREELEVYYQPKLDLKTLQVYGMEALVRWNHPERGQVSPGDFVPLAEETGLISEVGLWVLISSCVQVQTWIDKGYKPMPVSVNLSGRQLENSDIVGQVAHVLGRTGLRPEYLELELTESILMKRPEEVISILQQLKAMGVKLSIDDFGTGYSSLNYLRKFPIDLLKIDRAFIRDITNNNEDRLIVKSIIALAKSLDLKVLAEGVESKEQQDILNEEGCDYIQGFYIGRPIQCDEFENEFILRHAPNVELLSNFRQKQ